MGLDWNPLPRPKAGHEEEFERLFHALASPPAGEREALSRRFGAISEAPFETIGAPRVGFDAAADEWLRAQVEKMNRPHAFDAVRAQMRGYNVIALLPDCDGFPVYSNCGLHKGVARYSFRAKALDEVRDIIGDKFYGQAYERMLARDHLHYGQALFMLAEAFARTRGVIEIAEAREPPDELGTDASRAHILTAAGRWCLFWAERGHGLDPSF
jgi:hypothetical protein